MTAAIDERVLVGAAAALRELAAIDDRLLNEQETRLLATARQSLLHLIAEIDPTALARLGLLTILAGDDLAAFQFVDDETDGEAAPQEFAPVLAAS